MKVYMMTEREMEELRDKFRAAYVEHCVRYGVRVDLMNDPQDHSHQLFATFNFIYCRWLSDMGGDLYTNIIPKE